MQSQRKKTLCKGFGFLFFPGFGVHDLVEVLQPFIEGV